MKYYTSDLHFGHALVAETRGYRLHADDIAEHDARILDALHTLNPKGDQLWILGDLSGGSKRGTERALELLAEVPVVKHLILGNHDPAHPMHRDAWKWQRRYLEVFESIQPYARQRFTVDDVRHDVLLSHFPYDGDHTEEARYSQYRLRNYDRWLLHGHTHSDERYVRSGRQIHVGWDAWRRPVGEDEIADMIRMGAAR